jgi:hypothetical protein
MDVYGNESDWDRRTLGEKAPTFWGVVDPDGLDSITFQAIVDGVNVGFAALICQRAQTPRGIGRLPTVAIRLAISVRAPARSTKRLVTS